MTEQPTQASGFVAFGALGGTIAMTPSASGGIVPTLQADDLVGAVASDLGITMRSETLRTVASASIHLDDLDAVLTWARAQVGAGASGVVVSQGTDTLEETSWLLDLAWDLPEPLIVTGAMRGSTAFGADGPGNVAAALRVATSPGARGRGVLVTLADRVHAARWVAKSHTSTLDAFTSPGTGPVGLVAEQSVHWFAPAASRSRGAHPTPLALTGPPVWVPLLTAHLTDDGRLAQAALDAGAGGLVVAGSGVGHVSEAAADVLAEAATTIPVVLASRINAGMVHEHTYGYPGGEIDLLARGLIGSGWLNALKARGLLHLLLANGADAAGVRTAFAQRGALEN